MALSHINSVWIRRTYTAFFRQITRAMAKTDLAFTKNIGGSTNLEWFILRSEDASFYSFPFGRGGDSPAVGDYDGDGKADPAIYRKNETNWYIQQSTDGMKILSFGNNTDIPVALYPATY